MDSHEYTARRRTEGIRKDICKERRLGTRRRQPLCISGGVYLARPRARHLRDEDKYLERCSCLFGVLTARRPTSSESRVSFLPETTGEPNVQGCCKRVLSNNFGKSKVSKFHVHLLVREEDILGLNVSMDNPTVVLAV